MSLKDDFDAAVATLKTLPDRPDNATLLKLYALFKQAGDGDVATPRPVFPDLLGAAKWDAWDAIRGTSTEDAMRQYIGLVDELKD